MSDFSDNPIKILDLLKQFSDKKLQILFGDSENFKQWFDKILYYLHLIFEKLKCS